VNCLELNYKLFDVAAVMTIARGGSKLTFGILEVENGIWVETVKPVLFDDKVGIGDDC